MALNCVKIILGDTMDELMDALDFMEELDQQISELEKDEEVIVLDLDDEDDKNV